MMRKYFPVLILLVCGVFFCGCGKAKAPIAPIARIPSDSVTWKVFKNFDKGDPISSIEFPEGTTNRRGDQRKSTVYIFQGKPGKGNYNLNVMQVICHPVDDYALKNWSKEKILEEKRKAEWENPRMILKDSKFEKIQDAFGNTGLRMNAHLGNQGSLFYEARMFLVNNRICELTFGNCTTYEEQMQEIVKRFFDSIQYKK